MPAILALLALLLWVSLPVHPAETYSFGVLPQRSAVLTAEYWNPILGYVERRSGVSLSLKVGRAAPEFNEATEDGHYDFVYTNTIFQPKMAQANYQVILRPLEEAITGQIVTLEDTPIKNLKELAGREVGFPSQAAFVGYAVPMDHLLRQGIAVTPVFGGNQEGIMGQLKARRVAAAGVNSQVMKAFAQREHLRYRVLWESEPFLNLPIAAHPRVPQGVVHAVTVALDAMDQDAEGRRILAASAAVIGQQPPYGFRGAGPQDYENYFVFYKRTLVKDIR